MDIRWTACSICTTLPFLHAVTMAVFKSLDDALEYVAWVNEYDADYFERSDQEWINYVVEGDFINE